MIFDYFSIALRNLIHRKLRSWLTVLGIVIGVGAVIALLAASDGLETSVRRSFETFGANRIYVMSGAGVVGAVASINTLTEDDARTIENIGGVKWVLSYTQNSANVEFGREKKFQNYIIGLSTEDITRKYEDFSFKIAEGRIFHDDEKNAVIVGPLFAKNFFKKEVKVGNELLIKGKRIPVIGIYEPIGSAQDDSMILIPSELSDELFDNRDEVSYIEVRVQEGIDVDTIATNVERKLKRIRRDENFEVLTPDQLLKTFGSILIILKIVLTGVASISILVGAVGIMNSMFTNVLERTKEIGIMKSVGARNVDVLTVFLFEAGIVGFIGGVFGVILGIVLAEVIEIFTVNAGYSLVHISVGPWLAAFGILFAVTVGILSGLLPAMNASKLIPVKALRVQ
ncbi:hypothetical protein DRJ17_01725 [Candidatus Woesearchaeota archaeon]|nr:MAG: hypothetical protein DRJ17_01725 [Candidatus Woesearchaeota archaeon]